MQYELLEYLKCPITKTALRFKLISESKKSYAGNDIMEIKEGLLFSETGFVFPIINGIPRMLIESMDDYDLFLKKNLSDYQEVKRQLDLKFPNLINYCIKKNKRTKASFNLEWNILDRSKKDEIWQDDVSSLPQVFMNEMGEHSNYFVNKHVIDIGCGHGIMTTKIAELSNFAIGIELSNAIEDAYNKNEHAQAWYIQGDLQFLPFNDLTFDIVYSSGVIHHTNNTELSFFQIESILKTNGKICLWLYHPQKSIVHNLSLLIRQVTKKLPLKLTLVLLAVFIFPVTFLIKKIRHKRALNYREEFIYLLDGFTPEFRFEIPHDIAASWLQRKKYTNIAITTSNQYGFSIVGEKT